MSRRRLIHGTAARVLIMTVIKTTKGDKTYSVVARGNVERYRAERGISPRGLRPKKVST